MLNHFEELWEESEKTLHDEISVSSSEELIAEIIGKLSVYSALDTNSLFAEDDKSRLKTHTLGKILLSLTKLSAKDNVNVFAALKTALDEAKINLFESKYK